MGKRQGIQLRVDTYTRVCMTVIAGLLTVLILGLWADGVAPSREAVGAAGVGTGRGLENVAARQRAQIIKALEANTAKVERLVKLFESGKAKVQVVDDGKAGDRGGAIKIKAN